MGAIQNAFDLAFRDFATSGIPASGPNEPRKVDIRAIGTVLEQVLSAAGVAQQIYETTAAGIAGTTNEQLFLVAGDGDDSFADLYKNNVGTAVPLGISIPSFGRINATFQPRSPSLQAVSNLPIVEDTFIVGGDGTFNLASPAAVRALLDVVNAKESVALSAFSAGDLVAQVQNAGTEAFNGATIAGPLHIAIPAGQTGKTSYLRPSLPFNGAAHAGKTFRFRMSLGTSSTFTRSLVQQMSVAVSGMPYEDRPSVTSIEYDAGEVIANFDYTVQGDETAIRAFVMINAATTVPTSVPEFFKFAGMTASVLASSDKLLTAGDENAALLRASILSQTILRPAFAETINVRPSGGDFTTLSAAVAAITDSSPAKQYKIAWWAGATLGTPDFHVPAWTSIICQDPRDDAVMTFVNPDNATAGLITNTSLLWIDRDGVVIEGGTWTIKNGRYVFHWETNSQQPNSEQRLINVVAKHLGNADAINNAWVPFSQYAAGCGVSAGQIQRVEDCDLRGPGGGFSSHSPNDGQPWETPFLIELINSRFEATDPAYRDILLKPIAMGPGRASIRGCSYDELGYFAGEWLGGNPGSGVNCAQIAVAGTANTNLARTGRPTFFNGVTFGNAAGQAYAGVFTGA